MNQVDKASFKNIWQLVKPYWVSGQKARGWILLSTILALVLGQVYLSVLLNQWNATFYNALQDKNLPVFLHQLGVFGLIAIAYIAVAVYRQYFGQMLHIDWRTWMTQTFQKLWLSDMAYYQLQVIYKSTDNPDQRIADDIDGFTSSTLSLGIGLLSSVVTLASFVTILWNLGGPLNIPIHGYILKIPGFMVWTALLYSIIGSWLTHKIGYRLVNLNYDQQRFEANFRFSMIRLRENAEAIAFYKGEEVEAGVLQKNFSAIVGNWWQIMKKQKQLTWFTSGYAQVAIVFPILVAAPRYFSGAIQLGGLMQTASAFGRVQESCSWLIDVYPQYANWKATSDRLDGFVKAIAAPSVDNEQAHKISISRHAASAIDVKNLALELPDGSRLARNINLDLAHGDRLLIQGVAGSGKTTFLRVLAGMWPYGHGSVALSKQAHILFVPQKPYLPLLPLRNIICYPAAVTHFDPTAITDALDAAGLGRFSSQLEDAAAWGQSLSPGEQQKLALARIYLHRPDILLLDEATASMDESSEAEFYEAIIKLLPQAIIISVGHKQSLEKWHTKYLPIQK